MNTSFTKCIMNYKTLIFSYLAAIAVIFTVGCSAPPMSNRNSQTAGAVSGGLLGATAGGIIGHQSGRTGEGAALGGLIGGAYGAQNGSRFFGGDGSVEKVEREGR